MSRAERVGANEAIFRELNEQIEALATRERHLAIVCECGRLDCAQRLTIPVGAYEHVRSDPRRFVIAPGHELPDVERIVGRSPSYAVVEKEEGEPSRVAERTDPRDQR